MPSILFVCLGNICRSPTAEAVFTKRAKAAGLKGLHIDGAGTGAWHAGNPPDRRATKPAAKRGYDLTPLRARQVRESDFEEFDLIVAMDKSNLADLNAMAPDGQQSSNQTFSRLCIPAAKRKCPTLTMVAMMDLKKCSTSWKLQVTV